VPAIDFEVATDDQALVSRLAGPQGVATSLAHEITSGAVLLYLGPSAGARDGAPAHVFRVEFGTSNVAATAANWLWSQLKGHVLSVRVDGLEVPLHHAALKDALLNAAGIAQPI
jgi:hypothetical protein